MAYLTPGQTLFDLIQAMDAKERRYFRLSTRSMGQHAEKKYLLIYEFLLQQKSWSEEALRLAFPEEAFLKQLNVVCNYLYEKLLAALRGYDADKHYALEFSQRIDEVTLLFERRLTDQCLHRVQLAQRFAERLDLPHYQYQLLQWEIRLLRLRGSKGNWVRMQAALQEGEALLAVMAQEHVIQGLYSRLFPVLGWSPANIPVDVTALVAEVEAHPLMQETPQGLSFDAALNYHGIHAFLAQFHADKMGFARANAEKRACWERNKARRSYEETRYFKTLIGFVESAIEAEMFPEAQDAIARMGRLCGSNKMLGKTQAFLLLHLKLRLSLNTFAFDEAREHIDAIQQYLDQHKSGTPPQHFAEVCTNAAHAYFFSGIWSQCLHWLDKAAPLIQRGARMELTQKAGPMRMMALYAAGRHNELEEALRLWARNASAGPLQQLVHDSFVALLSAHSESKQHAILLSLHTQLQTLEADPEARKLLLNWSQARLEGRPLRDFYPPRTGQA